jgi:hypothetical protein
MKCLEKDRARRYETANGLASDLQRHLNNEAVLARPPSAAYRFQKLVRRNKFAFAAASAVAAALVIGLGAATVMFFRERLAREVSSNNESRLSRRKKLPRPSGSGPTRRRRRSPRVGSNRGGSCTPQT